jgi:chromosome partitioning protein
LVNIISVINQKGGVGKTTLTFNLAKELANHGKKILVLDNDPQANLTSCFLSDPALLQKSSNVLCCYGEKTATTITPTAVSKNIDLIGSDIHLSKVTERGIDIIYLLKENLDYLKHQYDFIFIDCLPSFGNLNLAALNAANFVLVPTKASPFSVAGLKDLFESVGKAQKRLNPSLKILGVVLNLIEGRKTRIEKEIEGVLRVAYPDHIFKNVIKKGTKLEESPAVNMSIVEYDPNGKDSISFQELVKEFLIRIKEKENA